MKNFETADPLIQDQNCFDYEYKATIHSKLELQSINNPDDIALIFDNSTLTYKQLNDRSNALANRLLDLGIQTEDFVVVCMDRSLDLIVSIFGILKSGGVYVPLLPSYPEERKNYIIEDANPKIIITAQSHSDKIKSSKPKVIIDELNFDDTLNYNSPVSLVNSLNLAYVIYTSGTTGKPKGVMIEHHSVMNRIGWMQKTYPINKMDVLIQKTSIAFDVSIWELFWWCFTGAKLFLLNSGEEKDPRQILHKIGEQKVTTIHFVPSMLNEFIAYLKSIQIKTELRNLKYIFCSGEALNVQSVKHLLHELKSVGSDTKIINLYGPTEATVDVTHYLCSGEETNTIPIGRPIDNTQIYIVNDQKEILGVNEAGELLISGVNLARGYLNRDELNNEKFICLNVNGREVRAYKTGDIASWDNNYNIIYHGRNDTQVKLRGYRIELGEIESKLRTLEHINDCAVIVHNQNRSDAALCGFYVSDTGSPLKEDFIKNYLQRYLPDYMIPSFFIHIKQVPTTSSGKLNKEELLSLIELNGKNYDESLQNSFENVVDQKVHQIWCDLLKKTEINLETNFFDIGGNSLLIIQMLILLNDEFKVDLNVFDLFQYTNIASISTFIKEKLNS